MKFIKLFVLLAFWGAPLLHAAPTISSQIGHLSGVSTTVGTTTVYHAVGENVGVYQGGTTVVVPSLLGLALGSHVTILRSANQGLKVPDFMLLANFVDPQGLAMSITWVSPTSSNGGTVTLAGRWITYEPPPGNDTPDTFTFRVVNTSGTETIGTATVRVSEPTQQGTTLNISSVSTLDQDVQIRIAGIPGRVYDVEVSTDLVSGVWTTLGEIIIGPLGFVEFIDEDVPSGTRFYRTKRRAQE